MLGNSRVSKQLGISQVVLSSIELVSKLVSCTRYENRETGSRSRFLDIEYCFWINYAVRVTAPLFCGKCSVWRFLTSSHLSY
jgi:hypothetical protein